MANFIFCGQKSVRSFFSVFYQPFFSAFLLLIIAGSGCRNNTKPPQYGKNQEAGNYADVNGIKLYYEVYGKGEPLVLLHGNGGSINAGSEQIDFFSKHFQVIAVDSRGQGKSKDNSDSLTYDEMASDLNGLLDHLKIDSAYIIGHSDGGIIGLITAIRYPKKVKMLAAMSPNIRPDSMVLYPKVAEESSKTLKIYEDSLNAGFKTLASKVKLLRLMQYHPHISNAELSAIEAPVLLLCADRDVIQLLHIIEIFRAIRKSNLFVLPGSTHFAPWGNSELYNESINRFFTRPFSMPDSY